MTLSSEDRQALRLVLFVVGGFIAGLGYLLYIIMTDLGGGY